MISSFKRHKMIFLVLLLSMIYPYKNLAQTETANNSIYFEMFSNDIFYSINYDRMFSDNFGGRIGLSYISEFNFIFLKIDNLLVVPATINYFIGKGKSKMEIGAGIVYGSIGNSHSSNIFGFKSGHNSMSPIRGTATFGYRYQPKDGGLIFRIGFTPFFGSGKFFPSGGISFGVSF